MSTRSKEDKPGRLAGQTGWADWRNEIDREGEAEKG